MSKHEVFFPINQGEIHPIIRKAQQYFVAGLLNYGQVLEIKTIVERDNFVKGKLDEETPGVLTFNFTTT